MKRIVLMMAATASVLGASAPAAPAIARDSDRDRRAERQEPARAREVPADRRGDDRRRDDERPPRPNYMDGPRPNYMSPAPGLSGRRGGGPDSYRGGVVDDYRRYRLRPPPQGYDWVRMGNGFALVERDSGRIFDRVD